MKKEDCRIGMEVMFSNPHHTEWFGRRSIITELGKYDSVRVRYFDNGEMCGHGTENVEPVMTKSVVDILNEK